VVGQESLQNVKGSLDVVKNKLWLLRTAVSKVRRTQRSGRIWSNGVES
jgi:hypothetical protein